MSQTEDLKLVALDVDDLAVLSAQLQDAVLRVEDMVFVKRDRRFAMIVNRFDWLRAMQVERGDEAASQGGLGRTGPYERRRSALRFEKVDRVQVSGIDLKDDRRVLSVLAVRFLPAGSERPDGVVEFMFSGGAGLKLHVECIEAEFRDLGAAWSTGSRPRHDEPNSNPGTS